MLDGITILTEKIIQVQTGTCFGFSLWMIMGVIALFISAVGIYFMFSEQDHVLSAWVICISMLAVAIGSCFQKPVYQNVKQYTAIIDTSASLVEFNKDYIMTDYDGAVFTFRERADNERP